MITADGSHSRVNLSLRPDSQNRQAFDERPASLIIAAAGLPGLMRVPNGGEHFRDPHALSADLRQLTAHDQVVRDTVMDTPGVREVLTATALQVQGYLAGPTAAPLTVVTQCAGGRHRAATTAMALRAVIAGDVQEAAAYGLADTARQFTDRDMVVHLVHRDLDRTSSTANRQIRDKGTRSHPS